MFIVIGDRCRTWILSFVIKLRGGFGCYPDKLLYLKWGVLYFRL